VSWNDVTKTTIENCFRQAGFLFDGVHGHIVEDEEDMISLRELMERARRCNFCDVDAIERSIAIEDTMVIHEDVLGAPTAVATEVDVDDEQDNQTTTKPVTKAEATQAMETLRRFCLQNNMIDHFSRISSFQLSLNRVLLFTYPLNRQSTLENSWAQPRTNN
jgi:hypothetical protein